MKFEFDVAGSERKKLAWTIGDFLNERPTYSGMPSMNYKVGNFTVTKNAAVIPDEQTEESEVSKVINHLVSRGFKLNLEKNSDIGLTITMPAEALSIENIKNLLKSKGNLIKKALQIDDVPIEIKENNVAFPWFKRELSDGEINAYTHFIQAICDMSKKQKRIASKVKEVPNEKYAFRCFLIRLGFVGNKYKDIRKILLKNLKGSSAFKGGFKNEVSE